MSSPVMVRVARRYFAPAERVFDAWLNPSQAARFLFATRTGNVMRCEIDPVVGGAFLVTDRRPLADGDESVLDVMHYGHFVAIERPHLLMFDVQASYLEQPTRVTLKIHPSGTQACEVVLTHDLGDCEEALALQDANQRGWVRMLERLELELFPRRISLSS